MRLWTLSHPQLNLLTWMRTTLLVLSIYQHPLDQLGDPFQQFSSVKALMSKTPPHSMQLVRLVTKERGNALQP